MRELRGENMWHTGSLCWCHRLPIKALHPQRNKKWGAVTSDFFFNRRRKLRTGGSTFYFQKIFFHRKIFFYLILPKYILPSKQTYHFFISCATGTLFQHYKRACAGFSASALCHINLARKRCILHVFQHSCDEGTFLWAPQVPFYPQCVITTSV